MITGNSIPKTIHYCWFGKKEKPDIVKRCINSWKTVLVDYEFIEWNEDCFNITCNEYIEQAYKAGKFAFVSDYVRVYALYEFGGIYLDTDVEVFKKFDPLLEHQSFWGFEQANYIATSTIGAAKGNRLIRSFLDTYQGKTFLKEDGSYDELTNVAIVSEILQKQGLRLDGTYQELEELGVFYPQTFFSPYDYINCRMLTTEDTYAVHHFYKSWLPPIVRLKGYTKKFVARIIGGKNIARIRSVISKL